MAVDLSMFKSLDDEGQEVELSRPETKGWDDVVQCINHNQGRNDPAVKRFMELFLLGIQWDWNAAYKQWLDQCEAVNAYNAARVADEETGELPDEMPLPAMPERPEAGSVEALWAKTAEALRLADARLSQQKAVLMDTAELVNGYRETKELGQTPTLGEAQYKQTLQFRQQLRSQMEGRP